MAAETFEATNTNTRAPESAPEPLISRPEMRELYSDTSAFKSNNTTGDTNKTSDTNKLSSGNGSSAGENQALDFNTSDLYRNNSQFLSTSQFGSDSGFGDHQGQQQQLDLSALQSKGADVGDLKTRMGTGTTHARFGEDLSGVAQRKLGENASPEQKEALVKALEGINGLKPGDQLSRGQELKLPGVNEKGDFVHKDNNGVERLWSPEDGRTETRTPDGTKTTNWNDGSTTIEQPNGDVIDVVGNTTTLTKADGTRIASGPNGEVTTTKDNIRIEREADGKLKRVDGPPMTGPYQKTDDGHGGTVERSDGQRPEDRFALVQGKDGKTEVFDKGPDGKDRVSRFMDNPAVEADRKATMERAEKHFTDPAELAKFKADMARFEQRASDSGMNPTKVADTYKAVNRMLDGGANAKLPQDHRNLLAQQVMSHAATPTSIDQGHHDTCAVAALESNVYTKDPDKAAGLVSEVALTGKFTTSDGKSIKVPDGSIKPDHEAEVRKPGENERDHASQIFQVTAVNSLWQTESRLPGWTYEQDRVKASDRQSDKGERTRLFGFDYQREFDGLNSIERDKINKMITGGSESTSMPWSANPQEMGQQLEELQRQGKLPRIVSVYPEHPPFNNGPGGSHALNITGYDPIKKEVTVDNQWGTDKDHIRRPIPLDQLWKARMKP